MTDIGGSPTPTSLTASVADAALNASAKTVTPTEGAAFSGVIASFTDDDPAGTATDYTASITWGDGHTSVGTVAATGSGGFDVSGTNTYAEEGSDSITVTIADHGASATANSTANVADAALHASGISVSTTEGASFSGLVATFTDDDPGGVAGDYTATIFWGDGANSSSGTVLSD